NTPGRNLSTRQSRIGKERRTSLLPIHSIRFGKIAPQLLQRRVQLSPVHFTVRRQRARDSCDRAQKRVEMQCPPGLDIALVESVQIGFDPSHVPESMVRLKATLPSLEYAFWRVMLSVLAEACRAVAQRLQNHVIAGLTDSGQLVDLTAQRVLVGKLLH